MKFIEVKKGVLVNPDHIIGVNLITDEGDPYTLVTLSNGKQLSVAGDDLFLSFKRSAVGYQP